MHELISPKLVCNQSIERKSIRIIAKTIWEDIKKDIGEEKKGRTFKLTNCSRVKSRASILNVFVSGDNGGAPPISEEHYVRFLFRNVHILSVHTSFNPNHVSLATLLRRRRHGRRHSPVVPAPIRRHHHVRRHGRRLQKPPIAGWQPLRPLSAALRRHELPSATQLPLVVDIRVRHVL